MPYGWFLSSFARDEYPWHDNGVERRLMVTAGLVVAASWNQSRRHEILVIEREKLGAPAAWRKD